MQTEALRQGKLNMVFCPTCGNASPAGTALLFHDGKTRDVVFAIPQHTEEYQWREQASAMLALLAEHLPPEKQAAYKGDVQIAQDVDGIAHILNKKTRRASSDQIIQSNIPAKLIQETRATYSAALSDLVEEETRLQEEQEEEVLDTPEPLNKETKEGEDDSQLLSLIHTLLASNSLDDFRAIVEQHPMLLDPATESTLRQFADMAFEEREFDLADSLNQLWQLLHTYGSEHTQPINQEAIEQTSTIFEEPAADVPIEAYAALTCATTTTELLQTIQSYPVIQEPWFESALDEEIDDVLHEGHDRMAQILEHRLEKIIELRLKRENGIHYAETNSPA